MRIALTYNVRLTSSEEEAEFDSPETIDMIARTFERSGHLVERVEVTGPASRLVAHLEAEWRAFVRASPTVSMCNERNRAGASPAVPAATAQR